MSAVAIFLIFACLIIASGIYHHHRQAQRQQALLELARRRGWQFVADHDGDMDSRFPAFSCLQQGSAKYAYNILLGNANHRQACGFDYHYETYSTDSKGHRSTHHHHFSAMVLNVGMPLKPLFIRTESFFDKIGGLFGFDDIDFESDEFSRTFCVKATDRRWAFDMIPQSTMEFLLAAPRFNIEFADSQVIAYRDSLFEPSEFEQALQVISGILDRMPESVLRELKGTAG